MRSLSNDYKMCQLIRLEPDLEDTPFVVMQEAYDPEDPKMRETLFWLQRDGTWVDDLVRGSLTLEQKLEAVFESATEAMTRLSSMPIKPEIMRIELTAQVLLARIEALKGREAQDVAREFAHIFRESRRVQ